MVSMQFLAAAVLLLMILAGCVLQLAIFTGLVITNDETEEVTPAFLVGGLLMAAGFGGLLLFGPVLA